MNKDSNFFDVDSVLDDLFSKKNSAFDFTLNELFNLRLKELKISKATALKIIDIEVRALEGIIEGQQKLIDFTNLIKIAHFLQISRQNVIDLYVSELEKRYPIEFSYSPSKIEFIVKNFDLATFKKAKFINSIVDFGEIEKKLKNYYNLKSIFDYEKPILRPAFSAGVVEPKNNLSRENWIKSAIDIFEGINNPNQYDREYLIKLFADIRKHSMNVEIGLLSIVRILFKAGVTVIYSNSLPSLHLRGATLPIHNKPCIVLTDYKGFYPTLWFALIHELYHVLFDWEDIRQNKYHLSEENNDDVMILERENEANQFAREYLLSEEKMEYIKPHLYSNYDLVQEFSKDNHVHPSFAYVFNAYDEGTSNKGFVWSMAHKHNPRISKTVKFFENKWEDAKAIPEYVKSLNVNVFNIK
jgi:HTH-type transcriptional regulator/antitoxin HigA